MLNRDESNRRRGASACEFMFEVEWEERPPPPRSTRATACAGDGAQLSKQRRKLHQDPVHPFLDPAQRVVSGHPLVQIDGRQKLLLSFGFSTHDSLTYQLITIQPLFEFSIKLLASSDEYSYSK